MDGQCIAHLFERASQPVGSLNLPLEPSFTEDRGPCAHGCARESRYAAEAGRRRLLSARRASARPVKAPEQTPPQVATTRARVVVTFAARHRPVEGTSDSGRHACSRRHVGSCLGELVTNRPRGRATARERRSVRGPVRGTFGSEENAEPEATSPPKRVGGREADNPPRIRKPALVRNGSDWRYGYSSLKTEHGGLQMPAKQASGCPDHPCGGPTVT